MNSSLGITAGLASCAIWAYAGVLFQKPIARHGPFACNLAKALIGGTLFWSTWGLLNATGVTVAASEPLTSVGLEDAAWLLLSGILGMAIGDFAYFAAIREVGIRKATLLHATNPLFVLAATFVLEDGVLLRQEVEGVLLTVLGVLIVVGSKKRRAGVAPTTTAGVIWGLLAAMGQASGILIAKAPLGRAHIVEGTAWRITGAVIGLVLGCILLRRRRVLKAVRPGSGLWRDCAWPALNGTFIGVGLMTLAIDRLKEAVSSAVLSTTPLFVVPLAWLIVRERVTPSAVIGTGVAVFGVVRLSLASA